MSDRFRPISFDQLAAWAFTELERKRSLFNVPAGSFFVPRPDHPFRTRRHAVTLDTPFGVAAGPHTQLAQNIVAAWLCGARVIELKTVQTLDEIDVHKPCIDVEDEGYNVEWSQELRVRESFDEYLAAWVLIHALHRRFGWPGEGPGVVFNMSVGYNFDGIRQPNMQWYLDAMADASEWLPAYVETVARWEPSVAEIEIPSRLSDAVTLSTMHGCPPDEIETISRYLLEERGLHTQVKCNPTLLGAERVRGIVNGDLGYRDVRIPDEAFGHDVTWADAMPMFRRLRAVADARGLEFGLKLSNTLEVENSRGVFAADPTMYMSGRALHAVTVSLAAAVDEELVGTMPLSFAGGADCFNVADLVAGGLRSVTVTSDLLKTGGYLRLLQYADRLGEAFEAAGATDTDEFVRRTACSNGFDGDGADTSACARYNLRRYADGVRTDWRYRKDSFRTNRTKTPRPLGAFDCIAAPCTTTCPIDQHVPAYMGAVARGAFDEAARIVREDNPLGAVLGRVCDHLCEPACVRAHLDHPVAIREIKRFVMDREAADPQVATLPAAPSGPTPNPNPKPHRVAIVGAGPAGLAAAEALAQLGVAVTMFEARPYPGGMVGGAIPAYRLPQAQLDQDLARVERLGVEVRYSMRAGSDFTVESLRTEGFEAVFVAVGAQVGKRLGLPGEEADGVIDGVTFLRGVREGQPQRVGRRVGVIGAGDTAMDCARSAFRLGAETVSLIYRRTIDQMPADPEEVHAAHKEGVRIVELAKPVGLHVADGRLAGVLCARTEYRGERDASGRRVPFDVPESVFEIALDTLILAISQHAALDCFGGEPPKLTRDGYIATDPETLETSMPGVYAGGDVAAHGPSSIVQAAADGKRAGLAIAARLGLGGDGAAARTGPDAAPAAVERADFADLMARRGRRRYRVPAPERAVERAADFAETSLGYSEAEARAEAARCLRCDEVCSLCVTVCPNAALLTYEIEPRQFDLPVVRLADAPDAPDSAGRVQTRPFAIDQRYQVAVLADLCNECGTCTTACPTAGAPYRDKPRLFLDREDFLGQESNAFLLLGDSAMEGRFGGETHRIERNGAVTYRTPDARVVLDPETFEVVTAEATGAGQRDTLDLEPAAIMVALLGALATSSPQHMMLSGAGPLVGGA